MRSRLESPKALADRRLSQCLSRSCRRASRGWNPSRSSAWRKVLTVSISTVCCPISYLLHLCADSKRSSPSLLARQLRLRLIAAEDSDIPRNLNNIVVSIHAIATFQALHDYLRPRVAGLLSSSSRLSGMLAALAASGLTPPSSRFGLSDALARAAASASEASAATSSAGAGGVNRRRSLRLSAKQKAAGEGAEATGESLGGSISASGEARGVSDVAEGESIASVAEPAPSDTVVNDDEFTADFTDDEVDVDAEVCL